MSSNKKQKKINVTLIDEKKRDWLGLSVLVLIGCLLFYPPYFQGLFFKPDIFINHVITALVFILVWIHKYRRRDFSLFSNPLDWGMVAYAVAYALSLINAVNDSNAIYGFLKAVNYLMIYWIVAQVTSNQFGLRNVLKVIIFSGLGVALIGVLAATGLINYPKAIINNHLASTLGYHNTLATLLSALSLLSITLMINEKNRWWQVTYCLSTYFMLVVTFAAVSKGAWIVLFLGLLLLVIGFTRGYRIKAVYFLGIAICSALIVSSYFTTAMVSDKPWPGLWFTLVGAVIVLLGWIVWRFIEDWLKGHQLPRPIIISIIALALIGGVLAINQMGLSGRFVQEISELTELENLSYVTRADFMSWAVDIVKDYPITGAGAGGWEALYRQYQDYSFWTTETHSHLLQVWVEAGTIGLLSFVSMWIIFFYLLYRLYKSYYGSEQWITIWGIAVATIGFGLHSSFDFDLSIPSMAILLWSLFALISSIYNASGINQTQKHPEKPWVNIVIASVIALIILVPSSQYWIAYRQANLGKLAIESAQTAESGQEQVEQLNLAATCFAKAVQNDPRNADYWSNLAYIHGYFYRLLNDQGNPQAATYRQQSIYAMYKAVDLNPYNTEILDRLIKNAAMVGDLEGIITFGNKFVKSIPNDPNSYSVIAKAWWDACQQCEAANQHEMAIQFAEAIIDLEKDLRMQLARVNIEHPFWQGEKLTMTPEFEAVYNQAQDFLDSSTNT